MPAKNLDLIARSQELQTVISNSVCTDANGNTENIEQSILKLTKQLNFKREQNSTIYLIGNGGSAAIASHSLTDFLNVGRLRAFTLHDSSLITCMANDFGYENAFSRIVNTLIHPGDILIAISSSGKSLNICNAARTATEKSAVVITLSGFSPENPLRKLGDINFWLDSCDYGMVEIGHQFILHNVADRLGQEFRVAQMAADKKISEMS